MNLLGGFLFLSVPHSRNKDVVRPSLASDYQSEHEQGFEYCFHYTRCSKPLQTEGNICFSYKLFSDLQSFLRLIFRTTNTYVVLIFSNFLDFNIFFALV